MGDLNCECYLVPNSRLIRFSADKIKEFTMNPEKYAEIKRGAKAYIYAKHNIDHLPGAIFLRNWSLLYVNEALKQVLR